jgi:2-oxoisovalerate dehydrogenase E2 component (dihydrolipoyl transacylase)
MSEYIFKLPDLGEGTVESEIGEWFIKVGDRVNEEDIVGSMMTDKAAVELSAPVSGTVIKLAGEPGDVVSVGAPLVIFETGDDVAPPADEAPAEPVEKKAVEKQPAATAARTEDAAPAPQDDNGEKPRVMTSPAIRRRAKEAGIDLAEVPGSGPGGRIIRKDFDNYLKARATGIAIPTPAKPSTRVKEI